MKSIYHATLVAKLELCFLVVGNIFFPPQFIDIKDEVLKTLLSLQINIDLVS